jgi:branched-chain amino acid transport system permease protein
MDGGRGDTSPFAARQKGKMILVLQLVIAGLSLGGIYALLSFSFSLIISTTRILNVAHGVFFVWGAGVIAFLSLHLKLSPLFAFPILLLFFAVMGFLFFWGVVRVLMRLGPHHLLGGSVLATFGLALAMESVLGAGWTKLVDPQPTFLLPVNLAPLELWGATISSNRLLVLILAGLIILGFHIFLKKTFFGRGARAMAQNMEGFLIIGLNPQRVAMLIIIVAILATVLSGILYILVVPIDAYAGLPLTLKAITIVVLAGVGSLPGTLAAGVLLGLAEVSASYFLGAIWSPVIGFSILFLVLLVRPTGLFGRVTI